MTTDNPDHNDETGNQRLGHRRRAFSLPVQLVFRRRLAGYDVAVSRRDRTAADPGSRKRTLDFCQLGIQLYGLVLDVFSKRAGWFLTGYQWS